ncbi:MAG: hypothetical protein ACK4I8_05045, partial [Armatimonadota bacterium]
FAGVKFRPNNGAWDLSRYESVYFDIRNASERPMVVYGKVANGDTENLLDNCRMATVLMPKERKNCKFALSAALKIQHLSLSSVSLCITTPSMSATTLLTPQKSS